MKLLITIFIFITYSIADLISLDKNGGNGIFTNSITIDSKSLILSAGGTSGVNIFEIKDDKLLSKNILLSSINIKDIELDSTEKYLYVAGDSNGLYVLDISDTTNPTTLATFTNSGQVIDLFIDNTNNRLAIANDSNGVYIYDISKPKSPTLTTTLSLNTGVKKVAILNDFVIVGFINGLVEVYDISNRENPIKTYTFSNFSSISEFNFTNGKLAILDEKSGIYIYNIERVDLPILIGVFPVSNGKGFTFNSNKIYITTLDKIIYTLDSTNLTKLQYLGSNQLDYYANSLVFLGDYLIASKLDRSLELLKETTSSCSSKVIYAQNPATLNWGKFYNSCDIPTGWTTTTIVPSNISTKDYGKYSKKDINSLSAGWHLLGTSSAVTDLSIFDNANSVWKYDGSNWYAYSANTTLNERIRVSGSYTPLTSIEAGLGFWVEIK